jgi:homoserine dehydrogenase
VPPGSVDHALQERVGTRGSLAAMFVPGPSSAPTPRPVRVGVLGAGTVGAALLRAMARHPELEVTAVLVRDLGRRRALGAHPPTLTTDPEQVLEGADVVVELIGGVERATDLMAAAAARGARLVTANKAALAERWATWAPWVRAGRVGFEAAVMAGTPVVGPLAGALRGSRLVSLEAVLNGTCAYLIGEMERGIPFAVALAEAVRLGYAEADPALDVDGLDAAHKLTLLARLTVAPDLPWAQVRAQARGIRDLTPAYLRAERAAGRRVRLVAYLEPDGDGGWRAGVEPRSLPEAHPLAWLGEGRNALVYRGEGAGEVWIAGPGAGAEATASAVLSDVLQAARGEPGPRPPLRPQEPLRAGPLGLPAAVPAASPGASARVDPDAERAP